jgi:putative nucleotidyltransferase with HDIG domain
MQKKETAIQLYVGAFVVLAAASIGFAGYVIPVRLDDLQLGSFVGFFVFALLLELAEYRLATGEARGSIAFIVHMGATISFGPIPGALVTTVSLVIAGTLNGRSALKTLFNVAQTVLALTVGFLIYSKLGGPIRPLTLDVSAVPYAWVVVSFFAINSCAVSGVITLSEGRRFVDVWIGNTWSLIGYDLVAGSLGLGVALLYANLGMKGFLAVVVPILFLRHTYLVNLKLQSTNRELLELMVKAIEARDPYTSGHSQRVSEMARVIAREMGLAYRDVENVATAGLLHDVGKIHEEFAPILRKKGKLNAEEKVLMESHPDRGAELVNTITNLQGDVERMVRHHHENFDGTGYPLRLVGDNVPLGSRIIMVADTTDAMTTDRPYRQALQFEDVLQELGKYSGTQFDPNVVEVFKKSTVARRLVAARVLSQTGTTSTSGEKRLRLAGH